MRLDEKWTINFLSRYVCATRQQEVPSLGQLLNLIPAGTTTMINWPGRDSTAAETFWWNPVPRLPEIHRWMMNCCGCRRNKLRGIYLPAWTKLFLIDVWYQLARTISRPINPVLHKSPSAARNCQISVASNQSPTRTNCAKSNITIVKCAQLNTRLWKLRALRVWISNQPERSSIATRQH